MALPLHLEVYYHVMVGRVQAIVAQCPAEATLAQAVEEADRLKGKLTDIETTTVNADGIDDKDRSFIKDGKYFK